MSANSDDPKPKDVEKWLHDQVVPAHDRMKQDPNIALTPDEVRRRLDEKVSEQESYPGSPADPATPRPQRSDSATDANGVTTDDQCQPALRPSELQSMEPSPPTDDLSEAVASDVPEASEVPQAPDSRRDPEA